MKIMGRIHRNALLFQQVFVLTMAHWRSEYKNEN